MSHDDFDFEPIRGLPAKLPPGEELLWQGAPNWLALAIRAYHIRGVAIYFGLLGLWRIEVGVTQGHRALEIATSLLILSALGAAAVGILALLAYLNARSTVYSITSRRIMMRHGVAVPLTMNVPFKSIDNAALKSYPSGTGDITIKLTAKERIGYLITWPHVRPGKFAHPEPDLRALSDARAAADILGRALAADAARAALSANPTVTSAGVRTAPTPVGRAAAGRSAAAA